MEIQKKQRIKKTARKIGDLDISVHNGELMIYKRAINQKPQIVTLTKIEVIKLREVINNG